MYKAKYLNRKTGHVYWRTVYEQWMAYKMERKDFICIRVERVL